MKPARKPSVPKAKNTVSLSQTAKTQPDDVDRLKTIARLLLSKLETSIRQRALAAAGKQNEAENLKIMQELLQQKHEHMFGARSSYVSTLVTLTDLLLKLENPEQAANFSSDIAAYDDSQLSDADVALVDAFVSRMKNQS